MGRGEGADTGGRGGVAAFVYFPFPPRTRGPDQTAAVTVVLRAGWKLEWERREWEGAGSCARSWACVCAALPGRPWAFIVGSINLTASLLVLQALAGS